MLFSLAVISAFSVSNSYSEESNDFFIKDAAKTVFNNDIRENGSSRFYLLKPVKEEIKPEVVAKTDATDSKAKEGVIEEKVPSDAKSIIAKYGDPAKEQAVLAQDSSPEPFKGMMAALNLGDRKLAFEYAKKYVKYMDKLDRTAKDAMALQTIAMEKESIISKNNWAKNEFKEERIEFNDQLNESTELPVKGHRQNMAGLDPKVKAFLNKAAEAEGIVTVGGEEEDLQPASVIVKPNPEELKLRQQLRASFAGKTPVDPKGEIDVYFFIRTTDQASIKMGNEFEKFYALNNTNKKARIVSLTVTKEAGDDVAIYRNQTNAKFPIANGSIFSKQLGIEKTPTVIMVARNSGQAVHEPGLRNFYYLDELAKHMMGVR